MTNNNNKKQQDTCNQNKNHKGRSMNTRASPGMSYMSTCKQKER